ncbi:patatin-like phospholipase family protein [Microcoleus sp. F4-D5]|uniref:patatin-like phospholipase family protein n=1 Tax=Microcoleus sp. F4-D5 TaxID=2818760 RepID=UPI004040C1A5
MSIEFLNATEESEFLGDKQEECDLVMKGGVTSGIVYPPIVLKLAKKYRFRSIGGTSAGAIAAAVTAAAEYGRDTGGFTKLKEISDQLSQENFLRNLFQPSEETQPLMDTLYAVFIESKKPEQEETEKTNHEKPSPLQKFLGFFQFARFLRETFRSKHQRVFALGSRRGLVIGLILALFLSGFSFVVFFLVAQFTGGSLSGGSFIILLLLLSVSFAWIGQWIGSLGVGVYDLYGILTEKVPNNFFGMCSGRKNNPTSKDPEALTDWLTAKINYVAGIDENGEPLTFGKLKQKQKPIDLKLVTSNLSHNQPYILPFKNHAFIFNKEEFSKLFPSNVVEYMTRCAYRSKSVELPEGFHFLPEADNLPVVVAMRMSLSFPILIGAVPLYTINRAAFQGKKKLDLTKKNDWKQCLQRNWFSDGGISSNFPIHLFDEWLPSRPTFGINLTSLSPNAFKKDENKTQIQADAVSVVTNPDIENLRRQLDTLEVDRDELYKSIYLSKANDPPVQVWAEISKLSDFIRAIWLTAQNYRDNTQSMLPSYRERVVQVRLDKVEGGLNLSMDKKIIKRVMEKGEIAGEKIVNDFKLEHHQWVRFQVLMGLLETELTKVEQVLRDKSLDCQKLAQEQQDKNDKYPYRRSTAWCDEALARVKQIQDLVEVWGDSSILDEETPRPDPVLRVTPEL